jgi:predicted dehydrogenase
MALFLAKTGRKLVLPLPWTLDSKNLGIFLEKIPQGQIFVLPLDCYRKNILELKAQLDQKILGDIGIAEFTSISEKRSQKWYQDLNISGGCRYQLLLPLLVVVTFLFGKIESSFGSYSHSKEMDYSNCSLKLSDGMLVSLEASWGNKERNRKTFEISGEKGNISFDSLQSNSVIYASRQNDNAYWDDSLDSSVHNPVVLFLQDLVAEKHLVPSSWLPGLYQLIETSLKVEEVSHG